MGEINSDKIDQLEWDEMVKAALGGSFLQSWAWGEVQEKFGVETYRLKENGAVALVLKREIAGGMNWLYVPRMSQNNSKLLDKIIDLGRSQKSLFIRIEPAYAKATADKPAEVPGGKWLKADHDVQPRHSLILDLGKTEDALLADMHQKTRYNIRLAEKKGVEVRFDQGEESLNAFLKLTSDVAGRGSFRFHPPEYYRAMHRVGCMAGSGMKVELGVAEHVGEVLAAHLLISFGDTVTYAHGASSSKKRELMAPHLLQWESIKKAKADGYKKYDFFGVAPAYAKASPFAKASEDKSVGKPHPWSGITRFKEGFGGERIEYPGAYDLALNKPGYWLYNWVRKLRR